MKIMLTESEIGTIRIISSLKSLVNRGAGVKDQKFSPKDGFTIDYDGMIGEYGFCKYFNLFCDVTINVRSGTYDCLYNGQRIDVKTSRHANPVLIVKKKKNLDIDVFALCIIKDYEVEIVGWIFASELYKDENLKDLGHGDCYVITIDRLKPFKQKTDYNEISKNQPIVH